MGDDPSPQSPSDRAKALPRLAGGAFAVVAAALLLLAGLAFTALQLEDTVRSYVKAESLWSKAEKEALISLHEYARTGDESDWRDYRDAVRTTLRSRRTRRALQSSPPRVQRAREELREFGMDPDEIDGMIRLFRWLGGWEPMGRSIQLWARGDSLIADLRTEARRIRREWQSPPPDTAVLSEAVSRVRALGAPLGRVERAFTASIDDAGDRARRWGIGAIGVLTALLVFGTGGLAWRLYRVLRDREEALHRSEKRYRNLFRLSNDAIFVFDREGEIQEVNERAAEFVGLRPEELEEKTVPELHPSGARSDARRALERTRSEGGGRFELTFRRSDGEERVGQVSTRRIELAGRPLFQAVVRDITEQREREERLRTSERRYRELFEHNVAGVFRSRPDGTILECNPAFARIFGYDSPEELEGRHARTLFPSPEARERYVDRLREEGYLVNEELRLQRRDGTPIWVLENSFLTEDPETGAVTNQGTLVDITDRKSAEERLEEMAYRDPLTGLANRRTLEAQTGQILSLADRQDRCVGLAYLDLDGFKEVNDRWDHETGDLILREVGERLERAKRETDLVARVGGDEFVVVLADLDSPDDALTATRRMTSVFDAPFSVEDHELVLDVSSGVAVYPEDGRELQELIRRADRAMYRAAGGGIERH